MDAGGIDALFASLLIAAIGCGLVAAVAVSGRMGRRVSEHFDQKKQPDPKKDVEGTAVWGKVIESYEADDASPGVGKIEVIDSGDGGMGTCFVMNGRLQLCEVDEHVYHEMLVHFACAFLPKDLPRRALVLRGGDCLALRELLKHKALEHVTVAEDHGRMLEACEKHLQAVDGSRRGDKRVRWAFGSMQDAVKRMTDDQLHNIDLVVLDLKDRPGASPITPQLCKDLRLLMQSEGVLACSGTPSDRINLRAAFPHHLAYSFFSETHDEQRQLELFSEVDLAARRPSDRKTPAPDDAVNSDRQEETAVATRFFDTKKLWSYVPWFAKV